jgi:hypothetical protein
MHYIYCTAVNSSVGRFRLQTQEDAQNVEGRACRLHIMVPKDRFRGESDPKPRDKEAALVIQYE